MKLGNLQDLMARLGVGQTYACALKKAAGMHTRLFDLEKAEKYLEQNPNFSIDLVYPRKKSADSVRASRNVVGVKPLVSLMNQS